MRNATTPTEANRSDYKMNAGAEQVYWNAGPSLADGVAGNGFISMAGTNGLTAQRSEVRAAHVRDGMSNTYLVGEKYLNPVDYTNGLSWSDDQSMLVGDYLDLIGWTNVPPAQDLRGATDYGAFQPRQPQRRPGRTVGQASACRSEQWQPEGYRTSSKLRPEKERLRLAPPLLRGFPRHLL